MKYGFIDVPTIYFFEEKNIFTGSCLEDFSFRIFNKKLEDESSELCCVVWDGKATYGDTTDFKLELHEPLTQEGLDTVGNKLHEAAKQYAANGYKF